jgi:hypothetical protein
MGWRPSQPPPGPSTTEAATRWVYDEFTRLAMSIAEADQIRLSPMHSPPPKPLTGTLVYADGTDWDPGGGEGLYVFLSGGWTKL